RFGHDLSLPYLMVQRGLRAVYEPEALASERPTPTNESEYRRKVRMFEHAWLIVLRGRMLRGQRPGYFIALVSHRHLRYASGLLHLILLGRSIALIGHGAVYAVCLGLQLGRSDARSRRAVRLLRKLSLDELPALSNAVRGEMSVTGPRPTLRYPVDEYDHRQRHRQDVRPSTTGWAPVNGRVSLPSPDRI